MQRQNSVRSATEMGEAASSEAGISPELVRAVADRVYAMLRRDLQIERERNRLLDGGLQRTESQDR